MHWDNETKQWSQTLCIPDEGIKGMLIGRGGVHIRYIEKWSGCSLIIGDRPKLIMLDSSDKDRLEVFIKIMRDIISIETKITFQDILGCFKKHMKCQGNCEEHSSEVYFVEIRMDGHPFDKVHFWYCENAIKHDEGNGFQVIICES